MNIWSALEPASLIGLSIVIPLVAALLVGLLGKWPNLREAASIVSGVLLFTVVLSLLAPVMAGERPAQLWLELFPDLNIAFEVEPLGLLFALVASLLWIVTTIYAMGYMRGHHEQNQTRFFICFALAISSVLAICFSANLLTLFIFYEVLTLSTYPLVTHAGTEDAKKGGRMYLGILLSTSVAFLLFAILLCWHFAGSLDFVPGGILHDKASAAVLGIMLVLFCFGIGKAALMPFHKWLPAAMVAPTPVSALLHAVAVVKAGVFTVLKVAIYIFGLDTLSTLPLADVMLYLAAGSVLLASCIAITKDNLKARLAYSTVSQLSYITLGALLASPLAAAGAALHIATHAVGKITLFFCAGAIMVASHKKNISEMVGLGRQMPFTMAAFFIGAVSIIGLPPMAGTWSKWYLTLGALDSEHLVIVAVLMLSSLLNIFYLLPIPIKAFFATSARPTAGTVAVKEAPLACLLAMAVTSGLCVLLFFMPQPLIDLVNLIPDVSTAMSPALSAPITDLPGAP